MGRRADAVYRYVWRISTRQGSAVIVGVRVLASGGRIGAGQGIAVVIRINVLTSVLIWVTIGNNRQILKFRAAAQAVNMGLRQIAGAWRAGTAGAGVGRRINRTS